MEVGSHVGWRRLTPVALVLGLIGTVLLAPPAPAQTPGTLALWDEYNVYWAADTDPNVEVTSILNGSDQTWPPDLTYGGFIHNYAAIGNPPIGMGWVGLGENPMTQEYFDAAWTESETLDEAEASDPKNYFEFSISPVDGALMTLTGLSLDWADEGYGPRKWAIRSSVDGFAADLATGEFDFQGCSNDRGSGWRSDFRSLSVPLGPEFLDVDSTVTFRFYGYAFSHRTGQWDYSTFPSTYTCNDTVDPGWICSYWGGEAYCQRAIWFFDNLEIQGTTRIPVTTIIVGGIDSGVLNQPVDGGASMADLIDQCEADATNHGQFMNCVTKLTNDWRKAGLISKTDEKAIDNAAAHSDVGK